MKLKLALPQGVQVYPKASEGSGGIVLCPNCVQQGVRVQCVVALEGGAGVWCYKSIFPVTQAPRTKLMTRVTQAPTKRSSYIRRESLTPYCDAAGSLCFRSLVELEKNITSTGITVEGAHNYSSIS